MYENEQPAWDNYGELPYSWWTQNTVNKMIGVNKICRLICRYRVIFT